MSDKLLEDLAKSITESATVNKSEDGMNVDMRLKKSDVLDIAKNIYDISPETYKAVHDFDNDMTNAALTVCGETLADHVKKSNQDIESKYQMKSTLSIPGHHSMEKVTVTGMRISRNPTNPDTEVRRFGAATVNRKISKTAIASTNETISKLLENILE